MGLRQEVLESNAICKSTKRNPYLYPFLTEERWKSQKRNGYITRKRSTTSYFSYPVSTFLFLCRETSRISKELGETMTLYKQQKQTKNT
jgi:hypothetical protein